MNTKRPKHSSDPAAAHKTASPASAYGEMPRPADSAGSTAQSSASIAAEVRETTQSAGRAVREQAGALAAEIGQELGRKVEDEKTKGVEAMQAFAAAVNAAAREMEQQSPQVARYVREAAERMQSLSSNIGHRDINELMRSATDLARSRPAMFFAGAVAAGFALSRFLKSSARHEEGVSDEQWRAGGDGADTVGRGQAGDIGHANP